jgi:hypothetical protein
MKSLPVKSLLPLPISLLATNWPEAVARFCKRFTWTTVLKFSKFLATSDLVELNVLSFKGLVFFERMLRGEVTCKRNENRSVYRLNLPIFG